MSVKIHSILVLTVLARIFVCLNGLRLSIHQSVLNEKISYMHMIDYESEQAQQFFHSFAEILFQNQQIQKAAMEGLQMTDDSASQVAAFLKTQDFFINTSIQDISQGLNDQQKQCIWKLNNQQRKSFIEIVVSKMNLKRMFIGSGIPSKDMTEDELKDIISDMRNDSSLNEALTQCQEQSES